MVVSERAVYYSAPLSDEHEGRLIAFYSPTDVNFNRDTGKNPSLLSDLSFH